MSDSQNDQEHQIGEQDISDSTHDAGEFTKKDEIALYSRSIATSTNSGLVQPFVSMIALRLGATAGILGWIQAVANLLSTFLDPIFGRVSDKLRRRIPFIVISTITWSIPYVFLYWVRAPEVIIIIVACVNILLSLGNPAWGALQNELFPANIRAKLTGRVFWFSSFGSMIATLFTGVILTIAFGDIDFQKYILIPICIGVIISILGVLPFKGVKEPLTRRRAAQVKVDINMFESLKAVFKNKLFTKYLIISCIYALFWSFAWPLFSIKQVNVLNASSLEIAILEIIFALTTVLFITFGAKLSDKIGRIKLIFFSRFCMAIFPLLYIFATEIWHLYLVHFLVASLITFGITSAQAYLLDIIPPKESGTYFGFFTMITGIFFFFGSLMGGYLVEGLQNWYTLSKSLTIVFIIVASARFSISFLFLTLKEYKQFPYSFGELVKSIKLRRKG